MAAAYATFAAGGIYAQPDGDHEGRASGRQGRQAAGWGKPQAKRVLSEGVAWKVTQVLGAERALRHGRRLGRRHPPERGQDRHDRGSRRRLVRRLHARPLDRRLDGLPERRDPDALGARPGGRGRDVPGADLAPLHGGGGVATGRCGSSSSPSTRSSYRPLEQRRLRLLGLHPDRRRRPRRTTETDTTPAAPAVSHAAACGADAEARAEPAPSRACGQPEAGGAVRAQTGRIAPRRGRGVN